VASRKIQIFYQLGYCADIHSDRFPLTW